MVMLFTQVDFVVLCCVVVLVVLTSHGERRQGLALIGRIEVR
jgi:hypothetical protein